MLAFIFSLSATVTICCLFLPKLSIILLHPEKNIRQSMMTTSKHNNNFSTKGPQTTLNVAAVSNSTKHIAATVATPNISLVQQNGPAMLSSGTKNGKRAGVVIIANTDHKENGNILTRTQQLVFEYIIFSYSNSFLFNLCTIIRI